MIDVAAPSTFAALCQALDVPAVECRPFERLSHLPEWVQSLSSDGEFPWWFRPSLLPTPAAREKLRAWAESTPRPWPELTASGILSSLAVVGDELCAERIATICAERLPAPVVDYVVKHVVVVSTGMRVLGFAGSPRLTREPRDWQINVSFSGNGFYFDDLFGHEVAHTWTLQPPASDDFCAGAVFASAINGLALDRVPSEFRDSVVKTRDAYNANEDIADRLARSWGFRSIEESDEW